MHECGVVGYHLALKAIKDVRTTGKATTHAGKPIGLVCFRALNIQIPTNYSGIYIRSKCSHNTPKLEHILLCIPGGGAVSSKHPYLCLRPKPKNGAKHSQLRASFNMTELSEGNELMLLDAEF